MPNRNTNILITGASGFVGSFLVEEAIKRGLSTYAGVRNTSSRTYLTNSNIHFFEMDFTDKEALRQRLATTPFTYVIHCAGVTKADTKEGFFKYNFELTKTFVEVLQEVQPTLKKFIYISSLASYGPADNHPTEMVLESNTPHPIDTYGESKLATEQWLQGLTSFPFLIFRPTAVYGPREKEIFIFFKTFAKGIEGHIGRSPQKATFIYVKDLARLILDATLSEIQQKAYFVSDGNYYPTQELGRIARKVLQKSPLQINIPIGIVQVIAAINEGIGRLTGKMPPLNLEKVKILKSKNWRCDIGPLQEDFDFVPIYDLEKGVTESLHWYLENKWL